MVVTAYATLVLPAIRFFSLLLLLLRSSTIGFDRWHSCWLSFSRGDFKKVFYSVSPSLRGVANLAPGDAITDIKPILDKDQRMAMCSRINTLRRKLLRHLATPQSAADYDEDSTKIVPMRRVTQRHFWDVFHRLPLSTPDSTNWKAVSQDLDGCPEGPCSNQASSNHRDIEWAGGDWCSRSPSHQQKPAPAKWIPTVEMHCAV